VKKGTGYFLKNQRNAKISSKKGQQVFEFFYQTFQQSTHLSIF